MDGGGFDPIYVEDFPTTDGQLALTRRCKWIGAGYFETMENPIVAGRSITWADIHNRARVLLVTENFAREYWDAPGDAIGKRIGTGRGPGDWREIIGVVGNVRDDGITHGAVAVIYWPMLLEDFWTDVRGEMFVARLMRYMIRSPRVGTPEVLDELKQVVWSFQPRQVLSNARTLQGHRPRLNGTHLVRACDAQPSCRGRLAPRHGGSVWGNLACREPEDARDRRSHCPGR